MALVVSPAAISWVEEMTPCWRLAIAAISHTVVEMALSSRIPGKRRQAR
jgi:hypothetical protein